uniref:Ribonuclease H protein At1g65750 family n=1 Tax=Cajanus cajan TaxID=3821 RepID=A0A151QSX2_CAJCA|nr:Putative ribonuclease H protein At1g65750 family [Cajanus cajan]
MIEVTTCPCCHQYPEDVHHIFWECDVISRVWLLTGLAITGPSRDPHTRLSWLHAALSQEVLIVPILLWEMWKARNNILFHRQVLYPQTIVAKAQALLTASTSAFGGSDDVAPRLERWVTCILATGDQISLHTDGSCHGNQRRADFGGLLRDSNGRWLRGYFGNIGETNILQAELLGILQGLQIAWDMHVSNVVCISDSLHALNLIQHPPPV